MRLEAVSIDDFFHSTNIGRCVLLRNKKTRSNCKLATKLSVHP
jgi:hypothetical protein